MSCFPADCELSSNLSPFWIVTPFEFLIGSGQKIAKTHPTDSEWRKLLPGHRVPNTFIGPFFSPKRRGSNFQPIQNSRQSLFALGFAYLVSGIVTGFGQKSFARLSTMIMLHLTNPRWRAGSKLGEERGKHTKSRLVTTEWIPIPKIQRTLEMLREIVRRWKCENWESDLYMTNLKFLEFSGHFDRFSLLWAEKKAKNSP